MTSKQKKNTANRTHVQFSLPKATEQSKTGNNSRIKWEICPYVLTNCLEKIVDIPGVAFIFSWDTSSIGNKVPDREFY